MPDQPGLTIPVASSPAATEPGPPNGDRFLCVITTCPWYLDVPPAPILDVAVLDDVFGPGVMTLEADNQRRAHIDRELKRHFSTHTVIEFATEIASLTKLSLGLTSQVAEMGEAYRIATAALRDCGPFTPADPAANPEG